VPDPVQTPGRSILIVLGLVFLAAGLLWPVLSRYWPVLSRFAGRLPGDIVIRKGGGTIYFPIVTCLVLSLLVSLLLWLFRR
jgi:hypothetical protein